jgi:hypothetical protein
MHVVGELAEMVFEVADVIDEHDAEGDALALVRPDVRQASGVGVFDGVGEVAIESEEEREDFGPGFEVESLESDEFLLLIAGEVEFARELEAEETLEVVGAGVDEMADGLLG